MLFKVNAAKDEAISQISESEIIILNQYTGEYQTANPDYIFLLMNDRRIRHRTVLIPETEVIIILKKLASNVYRNEIDFDDITVTEKYSFGEVTYHCADIKNVAAKKKAK